MAQVIRKFATGGTYGKFIQNGQVYTVDDTTLDRIATVSPSAANALRRGQNVTVERINNETTVNGISDEDISNVSEKQNSRLRRSQGMFEGRKLRDIRSGYDKLASLQLSQPTQNSESPKEKKVLDMTGNIILDYITNKDGSKSISSSGNNASAKKRLERYLDWNSDGETWDEYKVYKGLVDKSGADKYTDTIRHKINQDFWNRWNKGTLTDDDKSILKTYGILTDNDSSQEKTTSPEFNSEGLNYDTYRNRFILTNGNYQLTDESLSNLLSSYGGNLWLNNDFKQWARTKGYDSSWIPENTGLFRINGKWYDGSKLNNIKGNERVVFDNWRSHNMSVLGGDNSLITQYWGSQNPYKRGDQTGGYSPIISDNDYYYDRSGEFRRNPSSPLVYDIVNDEIRTNPENFDQFGHLLNGSAQRIYIDPRTKKQVEIKSPMIEELDKSIIAKYYDPSNVNRQTAFSNYITYANGQGKLAQVQAWGDVNKQTGYALLYDPITGRYYWHSQNFKGDAGDLNQGIGNVSNSAIQIDDRMAKWILDNLDNLNDPQIAYYIDRIIGNPYLRAGSWRADADSNDSAAKRYGLAELLRDFEQNGYTLYKNGQTPIRYNFDSGGNNELYSKSNNARRYGYVLDLDQPKIESHKDGGNIEKLQFGGVAYDTSNAPSKTKITETKPIRAAGEEKIIGDGTNLNSTDKAELAALLADSASLAMSFVPVYGNVAGAITGAGASLTNFYADVKRDGFDLKDLGTLGLGLGLDVATLLPGLGTGAKAAKLAKVLKNSNAVAKLIRGIALGASAAGATGAIVTSWDKLQNGNWTINDIRNIINGIRGVTNIGKIRTPNVKKSNIPEITIGKEKIKLSREELDDIIAKPSGDQITSAKKLLTQKLKLNAPINAQQFEALKNSKDQEQELINLFKSRKIKLSESEAKEILSGDEKSLMDRINNVLKESISDINVQDYFKTKASIGKGTWYKPWTYLQQGKIKNIDFGKNIGVLDPKDAKWYQYLNGKRRAAIRHAKTNGLFGYHNIISEIPINYQTPLLPIQVKVPYNWSSPLSNFYPNTNSLKYVPFKWSKPTKIILQNGIKTPLKVTPWVSGNLIPTFKAKRSPKSFINKDNYLEPIYKKGGIIKAENGAILTPWEVRKIAQNNVTAKNLGVTTPNFSKISGNSSEMQLKLNLSGIPTFSNSKNSLAETINNNLISKEQESIEHPYTSRFAFNSGTNGTTSQDVRYGGGNNKLNINPKWITDAASFIGSHISNNAQHKEMAKGIIAMAKGQLKSHPTEIYKRFSDNGLLRAYDDRIRDLRYSKTISSDPILNMTEHLVRDQQADQLARERDLKFSQEIDKFNDETIAAKRAYADRRTEVADHNRAILGQMRGQLAMNEANRKNVAWNGITNQLLNQIRTDITLDQNERSVALAQKQSITDQNNANTWAQNQLERLKQEWTSKYEQLGGDSMSADTKRQFFDKFGSSSTEYANNLIAPHIQDIMSQLEERKAMSLYNYGVGRILRRNPVDIGDIDYNRYRYTNNISSWSPTTSTIIPDHRSGGSIARRSYNEQALLDNSKDVRRTIKNLDDNLVRLIMKMLS